MSACLPLYHLKHLKASPDACQSQGVVQVIARHDNKFLQDHVPVLDQHAAYRSWSESWACPPL